MPPLFTDSEVHKIYELLSANGLKHQVMEYFRPDAVYCQTNTGMIVRKLDQIRWVLEGWKVSFGDTRIRNVRIVRIPGSDSLVLGSAMRFMVTYVLTGTYRCGFLGAHDMPEARGHSVRLPVVETLWADRVGLLLRLENTIDPRALVRH